MSNKDYLKTLIGLYWLYFLRYFFKVYWSFRWVRNTARMVWTVDIWNYKNRKITGKQLWGLFPRNTWYILTGWTTSWIWAK